MNLKNKLVMAGVGVAAIVAAACSGGKEAMPVVTPAQGVGLTPAAATSNYSGAVAQQGQSGSEMVHDYLAKTTLSGEELGTLVQVLNEMQTDPKMRIDPVSSWSYNYILIGNKPDQAHQGKLASLALHSSIIWKPGYFVVSYPEPSNPSDPNAKRVTLEEVANAAYGPDHKVAAALGFAIDRKAPGLNPSFSSMYVAPR